MQNYKAQSIVYEQGICKHQTRTVDDILWTSPSQLQTGLSYARYNNQLVQHTSLILRPHPASCRLQYGVIGKRQKFSE